MNQLTNEEKIKQIKQGTYSVDLFIQENEGMIKSATTRYTNNKFLLHHQFDEVLNAARFGFYRAIQLFDAEKGYAFTTLAYKIMGYEINNCLHRSVFKSNKIEMYHHEFDDQLHDSAVHRVYQYEDFNTDGLQLTQRQKEIYLLYLQDQNFDRVAERLGVRKQTVHESVKKTQLKMREKYQELFAS